MRGRVPPPGRRVGRWYHRGRRVADRRPNGGRPLEPDRSAPDAASADPGAASASTSAAPGLREQLRRTKDALVAFARAHVDLAKAEAAEIGAEVKRAAALAAAAAACLVLLAFFLPAGLLLFLGEWLFGSIGWGLLHGTLLLVDVAMLAILIAIRARGLGRAFIVAAFVGLVLALVLGSGVLNEAWRRIGDAANLGDPAWRPLETGVIVVAALGVIGGFVGGARASGVRGAIGGAIAGAIAGALIGAFSAITFGWRAGAGLGVALGLAAWPVAMGLAVSGQGIDAETLKARFWPQTTIDTAKETIEWAKSRMPLGPTS